jgi:hypothetical protein
MPSLRLRRGQYKATGKYIYTRQNRKPSGLYRRVRRGIYRRPYNATKWSKMMQGQAWRNRLKGKSGQFKRSKFNKKLLSLPYGVLAKIDRYAPLSGLAAKHGRQDVVDYTRKAYQARRARQRKKYGYAFF